MNEHGTPEFSNQVLTVSQVAEYLQMSDPTVYRLIQNRSIPAFKIGGSWRIKMNDLQAFIEKKKIIQGTE